MSEKVASLPDFETVIDRKHENSIFLVSVLGVILIPLFLILDTVVMPDKLQILILLRAVPVMVFLLVLGIIKFRHDLLLRHLDFWTAFPTAMTAFSIAVMCWIHRGYESHYYAGITLVLLATAIFYSWKPRVSFLFLTSVILFYLGPLLFGAIQIQDLSIALGNLFFLASNAIVVAASQSLNRKIEKKAHDAQVAREELLEELTQVRDSISSMVNSVSQRGSSWCDPMGFAIPCTPKRVTASSEPHPQDKALRTSCRFLPKSAKSFKSGFA